MKKRRCRSEEPSLMGMFGSKAPTEHPGLMSMLDPGHKKNKKSGNEFQDAGHGMRLMTDAISEHYDHFKKRMQR